MPYIVKLNECPYDVKRILDSYYNESPIFEETDDIYDETVIGYSTAYDIIYYYGFQNAQDLCDEKEIDKPLANIETVATNIIHELLLDYVEFFNDEDEDEDEDEWE